MKFRRLALAFFYNNWKRDQILVAEQIFSQPRK